MAEEPLFKRLSQLFRNGPVVKRKIKDFRQPSASSALEFFAKSNRSGYSNIVSTYGQYDRLARYSDFCFDSETLIPTVDGVFTIKELTEKYKNGQRFHVYSYDHEKKCVTIGTAHDPRLMKDGEEVPVVKVLFDDGGSLITTPDHKFMLRDGSYVEAKDLKELDSLMPFYVKDINDDGYLWVYTMNRKRSKGGWLGQHIFNVENIVRELCDDEVVHHKDFNRQNNSLTNLQIMKQAEHQKYHAQLNNRTKFGKANNSHSSWMIQNVKRRSDITFEKIVDVAISCNFSKKQTMQLLCADNNVVNRHLRSFGLKDWQDFVSRKDEIQDIITHGKIVQETKSPEIKDIIDNATGCKTIYELSSKLSCTTNAIRRRLKSNGFESWSALKESNGDGKKFVRSWTNGREDDSIDYIKICNVYKKGMTTDEVAHALSTTTNKVVTRILNEGFSSVSSWMDTYENHKVKHVEFLTEKRQVYNITVDGHHNLAVGSLNPDEASNKTRLHSMVFARQCEMEYCLSGDTLIATPTGYVTIKELSEKYGLDKEFIVYAYDHEKKKIVPALGKQARQTRFDHAYKVTFNSGKTIVGTANHRLMLRDGTYKRIDELIAGDSMMPFYRRELGDSGYRFIYTMDNEKSKRKNGWETEHRVIAEWSSNRLMKENEVVHHKDFNKTNNSPENLVIMDRGEHSSYHSIILNGKKWDESNIEWINKFKAQHSTWMRENNPAKRHDITFGRVLEVCERQDVDFVQDKLLSVLDTDYKTIERRLKENGFDKFSTFAKAYKKNWKNISHLNDGEKNPRYDKSVTFQRICDLHEENISIKDFCKKIGTTPMIVHNRIKQNGFKTIGQFIKNYKNHKVVSVEYFGEIPLYDLTVDGYKNFATDSVISHNTPEIASAMDIYADETCSSDERGNMLHVFSENSRVKQILEELFFDTLNVNFTLRSWVRNLCKYGDFFMFIDVSPDYGVVNMFPIPVNEIEREEGFDPNNPLAHRFRWVTQGNQVLEDWQVVHLRLLGNDAFLPYGTSIIEAARRIWRQLILIEDAMLVYRIVRSPERRVFYIDVGAIPPDDVPKYLEEAKTRMRSNQVIDNASSRVDLRYNPLSVDEDYWIAVRGQNTGTKIDTLAGGQNATAIEDVEYIQKKLFAALKIPKAFLGYDEALSSKATLSQEDIRFSRTIAIIQKTVIAELNKLAIVHLYSHGFRDEDLLDFELKLSNPSTVAQQQKLELYRAKFDIMGSAPDGMLSRHFIRREIMGLTDDQIMKIEREKELDRLTDMKLESIKPPSEDTAAFAGGGGGGIPSGGSLFGSTDDTDGMGGEEGGEDAGDDLGADLGGGGGGGALGGDLGDIGDIGDEDTGDTSADSATADAGGTDEEEPEKEESDEDEERDLLTSDEEEEEKQLNSSNPVPLKASNKVLSPYDRRKYNKGRRDARHGPSKTGMPDLSGMLSIKADGMGNDPNDNEFLNRMSRESRALSGETLLDNKINAQMKRFDHMSKQTVDLISRLEQSDKFPKAAASKNLLLNEDKLSNEEDT